MTNVTKNLSRGLLLDALLAILSITGATTARAAAPDTLAARVAAASRSTRAEAAIVGGKIQFHDRQHELWSKSSVNGI